MGQIPDPLDLDVDGRSGVSREEIESVREDGELPSIAQVSTPINDANLLDSKPLPAKPSDLEHSRDLALISKSSVAPINKLKSQGFKKHDEDSDILLDTESDMEEVALTELEKENATSIGCSKMIDKSWEDYGSMEFCLVLSRKMDKSQRNVKLEANVANFHFVFSSFFC
uniref:Uncharacterized protein n=1 Tax=Nelumbo nucifera TaxID=4432 RepID=A0A822YTD2_NELNU|nr:TPA_asm: hypothetical protein HUJ06_006542 [Nelumbo nucifera]